MFNILFIKCVKFYNNFTFFSHSYKNSYKIKHTTAIYVEDKKELAHIKLTFEIRL